MTTPPSSPASSPSPTRDRHRPPISFRTRIHTALTSFAPQHDRGLGPSGGAGREGGDEIRRHEGDGDREEHARYRNDRDAHHAQLVREARPQPSSDRDSNGQSDRQRDHGQRRGLDADGSPDLPPDKPQRLQDGEVPPPPPDRAHQRVNERRRREQQEDCPQDFRHVADPPEVDDVGCRRYRRLEQVFVHLRVQVVGNAMKERAVDDSLPEVEKCRVATASGAAGSSPASSTPARKETQAPSPSRVDSLKDGRTPRPTTLTLSGRSSSRSRPGTTWPIRRPSLRMVLVPRTTSRGCPFAPWRDGARPSRIGGTTGLPATGSSAVVPMSCPLMVSVRPQRPTETPRTSGNKRSRAPTTPRFVRPPSLVTVMSHGTPYRRGTSSRLWRPAPNVAAAARTVMPSETEAMDDLTGIAVRPRPRSSARRTPATLEGPKPALAARRDIADERVAGSRSRPSRVLLASAAARRAGIAANANTRRMVTGTPRPRIVQSARRPGVGSAVRASPIGENVERASATGRPTSAPAAAGAAARIRPSPQSCPRLIPSADRAGYSSASRKLCLATVWDRMSRNASEAMAASSHRASAWRWKERWTLAS